MLPGRVFQPEDVVDIARRRIWHALVPFAVVSALGALFIRALPDTYRSEALIMLMPQRVSETYVRATTTSRIEDRLQSVRDQILSRSRLEPIIVDLGLYADERQTALMEEIVGRMRNDVDIEVVRDDTIRVAFIGSDPRTAMQVAERLATSIIEESVRDREVMATGTNEFLEAQLEDARRRLIDQERKLEQYKRRHAGELPAELNSNLTAVQNTQSQIQALSESINRDLDRRLLVERQLEDAERSPLPGVAGVETGGAPADPTDTQALLAHERATLEALELRLKPDHPEVGLAKRRIRDLERKAADEARLASLFPAAKRVATSPAEAQRLKRAAELRLELEQLDRQVAIKQKDEQRLRAAAAGYQQRAEMAGTREIEMVELTRDYATLQQIYTTLLAKKEDAKIAANLERRQVGEQFKLLDPPRLPESPHSPDRARLLVLALAAGLAAGVGLVALLEYRDSSFRTDDELERVVELPVLAVVPSMASAAEARARRALKVAVNVGLGTTVLAGLAVVAFVFVG